MAKSDVKSPAKEAKTASTNGKAVNTATKAEITIAEKLVEPYRLLLFALLEDKITIQRGELPLEVQDLEDEVTGLETRLNKLKDELGEVETQVSDKQNLIKEAKAQLKPRSPLQATWVA